MTNKVVVMDYLSHRHQAPSGMTLIETLISILLLAIVAAGACALVVHSMKLRDVAVAHYTALNICKNQMERARSHGYDSLNMLAEDSVVVDENGVADTGGGFRRTTSVTAVPGSSNLTELVVTTDIRNRITLEFGGEHEDLRTYFTQY